MSATISKILSQSNTIDLKFKVIIILELNIEYAQFIAMFHYSATNNVLSVGRWFWTNHCGHLETLEQGVKYVQSQQ